MSKLSLKHLFLFFVTVFLFNTDILAQSVGYITFNDTFTSGITYCPGDRQYDNWKSFRNELDTGALRFFKVSMKGTYAKTAKECNDSFIVRKIANALKNPGIMFSDSCNGNLWVVSSPGSCMASGCAKTADNVGIAADGAINACSCIKPSWQIRPAVGNSNWGGVNTQSCSPIPSQKMILEFSYSLYKNDASVKSISKIDICKNPNVIETLVANSGNNVIDSLKVLWSLNGKLQNVFFLNKKINKNHDTSLILSSSIKFEKKTEYRIIVWTKEPNGKKDENNRNDTMTYSFRFSGLPDVPQARDTAFCGSGEKTLYVKSKNNNDNIIWYNSSKSNKILEVGSCYRTQFHSPGIYKYFVSASGLLLNNEISTTFNGGNQQAGFMMDIKSDEFITIDSIALNIGATAGTYADIEVYMIDSTFGKNETNPSKWINMGRFNVKCRGVGYPTSIPLKFNLTANKRYGFYVQTSNVPSFYLQYTNGNVTFGDDVLKLNLPTIDSSNKTVYGKGSLLNWGGVFASRIGNIKFFYKIPVCESQRDSFTLNIKQLPIGANFQKGFPFNTPDLSTLGTFNNPDIASASKEINYLLNPPFGYANAEYGKTWKISEISIKTSNDVDVNADDTVFINPTSTSNAKLKFVPRKKFEDSLIVIKAIINDLKNNFCDTVVQRFLYIAFTPELKISASDTCLGNVVKFKNQTNTKNQSVLYKWYFGNGDSSTLPEPTYLYKNYGKYMVKLVAQTKIGIVKDTSFEIQIFDIPNIKFKVNNACRGDSLFFENASTVNSGKLNYIWDFGDGNISKIINPKHIYSKTGDFFVKLEAESNNCKALLTKKAYYFDKPIANFLTRGVCSFDTVFFTNKTKIDSGESFGSIWSFGSNNDNSNSPNPKYIYLTEGLKTIKLKTVSQFGCSDSITKTILILPSANSSFINNATCNTDSVIFINTSNEYNQNPYYTWDFGDGELLNGIKNSKHLYKTLGKKTVKLIAKVNNGCQTEFVKEINVMQQPIADFSAADGCIGQKIEFSNNSKTLGQVVYKWRFGDGDSSFAESPRKKFNPKVASTFNVQLIVFNNAGCRDTITKQINIEENPQCGYSVKSAQTGGFEFVFTPINIISGQYKWNFGDGMESTNPISKHSYTADGNYRISIFIKNNAGCTCIDSSYLLQVNHLGFDNYEKNKVKIFPNPSTGKVFIELNDKDKNFEVNVIEYTGLKVFSIHSQTNKQVEINLAPGVYFIEIKTQNGVLIREKIVIIQ